MIRRRIIGLVPILLVVAGLAFVAGAHRHVSAPGSDDRACPVCSSPAPPLPVPTSVAAERPVGVALQGLAEQRVPGDPDLARYSSSRAPPVTA